MIRVTDGLYELKIGSSILTRRGGTDANAPESPRKAILRDWHLLSEAEQMRTLLKAPERLSCEIGMLADWVPHLWELMQKVTKIV